MRMKELGAGRGVGHQCRGKWVPVILKSQKGKKKKKKRVRKEIYKRSIVGLRDSAVCLFDICGGGDLGCDGEKEVCPG